MAEFSEIQKRFGERFPSVDFFYFNEIDSTSLYLKQQAKKELRPAFCLAKKQTSGYGQQQRPWKSDDTSLTFSALLNVKQPLHQLGGLTQLVALKLIERLSDQSNQSFKVKWPNDIYIDDCKAGGILLESVAYTEHECWLVVGIGLNNGLGMSISDSQSSDQVRPGNVRLSEAGKASFLESIMDELLTLFQRFKQGMFNQYAMNYRLVDYFELDQPVIVYDNASKQLGLYKGLTHNGEVLVELDGTLSTFRSGNTSIRPI